MRSFSAWTFDPACSAMQMMVAAPDGDASRQLNANSEHADHVQNLVMIQGFFKLTPHSSGAQALMDGTVQRFGEMLRN